MSKERDFIVDDIIESIQEKKNYITSMETEETTDGITIDIKWKYPHYGYNSSGIVREYAVGKP